jgi:predicted amidohydrolase YtcJ
MSMRLALLTGFGLAMVAATHAIPAQAVPADVIVTGGRFLTMDAARPEATAMAIRAGRIAYIGSDAGALALKGPRTRAVALGGRRVLPGLVDAHIHPLEIVSDGGCDLDNKALTLAETSAAVAACVKAQTLAPGAWLNVAQWNYSGGNQPDAANPTLRAALDRAAPDNPVQLQGNDGHHGGFNSRALALARAPGGGVVGYSGDTLAGPLKPYVLLVGVDSRGEPNGAVNEDARAPLGVNGVLGSDRTLLMKAPQRVMAKLAASGITAFLDAASLPGDRVFYDTLLQRRQFTARATLAQYYDPSATRSADGSVDYDSMVAAARATRAHFATSRLIRADAVKLFADGVLEGDPQANPVTFPNSPGLKPYLRPRFGAGPGGHFTLLGYDAGAGPSGKLQHEQPVIMDYVRRMHMAGFQLHIHAIGDRAVHVAVDAIEAARAGDGARPPVARRDTLAHLQLVSPDDVARIGRDKLFLAMTYAWIFTDPEYDLAVIRFIDRVRDGSFAALHDPANYYERQAYPVRQLAAAGGVLAAGSDAPVETRDPRPFANMQSAVLRARGGTPPLGPQEKIGIAAAIRAYTIDGARSIGWDREIGSLVVGKSADFIVLDRDVLAVPAESIGATVVQQTWFRGKRIGGTDPR